MDGSTNLSARFREFVQTRGLLHTGERIVAAVSGGVDSVVLLHLLNGERARWGVSLTVAHFNHGLRPGAAEDDAEFVSRLAEGWGLPVKIGRGSVEEEARKSGRGMEDAARTLRYAFLEDVRVTTGSRRIATGHTADDNAETVLLNLLRGSGVRGLSGIPVSRDDGRIIRPLLFATRDEILAYASAEGLRWREDASNETDAYRRNIIRHHLLPTVREKINPAIARTLLRSAEVFGTIDGYLSHNARAGLDQVALRRTGSGMHLSCSRLLSYPMALQGCILQMAVQELTGTAPVFDRVAALAGLVTLQPGRSIELGDGWTATRVGDEIVIAVASTPAPYEVRLEVGVPCVTPGGCVEAQYVIPPSVIRHIDPMTEFVDAACAGSDGLTVRSWREGDSFIPLGMSGHKNVSDLLNEAGIAPPRKAVHPLVVTGSGEIVWVCGVRISERFKVVSSTHRVLQLTYQRALETCYEEEGEGQW